MIPLLTPVIFRETVPLIIIKILPGFPVIAQNMSFYVEDFHNFVVLYLATQNEKSFLCLSGDQIRDAGEGMALVPLIFIQKVWHWFHLFSFKRYGIGSTYFHSKGMA